MPALRVDHSFQSCRTPGFCFHPDVADASLIEIVSYCDRLLRTTEVGDYDGAANGLQVQNSGRVGKIAAAVDGSLATIELASAAKANLLVVHHGLFWGPSHPWTGKRFTLLQALLKADLAVYSSHLPLDAHPRLGNNAQLCDALGFTRLRPFFASHGQTIGFQVQTQVGRDKLTQLVKRATGTEPRVIPGGPDICRRIGVVTGGAGGELKVAVVEGVDTFITGEGPHWTYALAEELGLNVIYAGHYATETFGVKALAEHLSKRFKVPWVFIDHPTGL